MGEATPPALRREAESGTAAVTGVLAELLERCREEAQADRVRELPHRWAQPPPAPDPAAGYRGWSGI